jgi:hypothetical protein
MWYIHIIEYYPSLKRNEILIPATIWMNLGNIPSEINQTQKDSSGGQRLGRGARQGQQVTGTDLQLEMVTRV